MEYNSNPREVLSDKDLRISRFILFHKTVFKKSVYGTFIVLDIALILTGIVGIIQHVNEQKSINQALVGLTVQAIDWETLRPLIQSKNIEINTTHAIAAGSKSDLITLAKNPNINRSMEYIEYRFIWEGGFSDWFATTFIPGESKHLLALGQDIVSPTRLQVEFQKTKLKKVTESDPLDVTAILNEIHVGDISYSQTNDTAVGSLGSTVTFTVVNDSPFGFKRAAFNVIVSSQGQYSAADRVLVFNLKAFEQRTIEARFKRPLSGAREITIEPDINIFDEENILL